MSRSASPALAVARPSLTGLIVLNLLGALGIAVLVVTSLFSDSWPWVPLGFDLTDAHPWLVPGLQAIAFIGLVGAALVHTILRRLRAMVDTVRAGDPFIVENARRLQTIAWCVLAGEGLRLAVAIIASTVTTPTQPIDLGDGFSFTPWLAVLLLFVLAGVFAQGARMREELEGTI